MRILLLLILFFLSLNLSAQKIEGRIISINKDPISNALIMTKALNDSLNIAYTTSNQDGQFSLNIPYNTYELVIKSLGFNSYIDTINYNKNLTLEDITLDYKLITLEDVVVVSSIPTIKHTINGVMVNVNNSYLKNLPSMVDVLSQIPEINILDGKISILGKEKIGYLINGKLSNLNIENIPVSSIDKIEVISNPTAKYDASMEAVLNIILKKNSEQGFNGEISSMYEQRSKPRYHATGLLNFNKGIFNSTFTLSHSYSTTTNSTTIGEQRFYGIEQPYIRKYKQEQNSKSHAEVLGSEFSLNFNESNALSFQATWQPNYVPYTNFNQQNEFFSGSANPDSTSVSRVKWAYQTRFANAGVKYDFQINKVKADIQFDYLWQDDLTNTNNEFEFENFLSVSDVIITTDQYRKSQAFVPSVNGQYKIGESKLDFGVKYNHIKSFLNLDFSETTPLTPESDFRYNANENIVAAYFSMSSRIKKLLYEIGLRGEFSALEGNFNIDATNQNINELLPSVTLTYPIKDNRKLIFNYGKKVDRPPFSRISPLFYYTSPFEAYEGNPYLKPSISNNLQLQYSFGQKSITVLYNYRENAMGTFPLVRDNLTVLKYFNFNQTTIGGVVGFPLKHTDWLTGRYNLKLYYFKNESSHTDNLFKTEIFTSSIDVIENIKLPKDYNMSMIFRYSLPRYNGVTKIESYPSLDVSFSKAISNKLSMSLYIRDVFKTSDQILTSRDVNNVSLNTTNYIDSRGISFSFTYKFLKGRKTNTKTFDSDEIGKRL